MKAHRDYRLRINPEVSQPKGVVDEYSLQEGQSPISESAVSSLPIQPEIRQRRKGIIREVAGCLKDANVAKGILSLRGETDREIEPA